LSSAAAVAERFAGAGRVSTVDGVLRLDVELERTPELVRVLVQAGVDVHHVHPQERTLEDAFFALTGNDPAQHHEEALS
jgi:ABC-2 type transport system ATP-binding protein